ncbi:hypothetical protein J27TS7_02960 [Paenibacillus dendritiformis]|uniref:hypothetical protein n=1 Tax=Paenibacillus dendritiformis TaxID=130049 RepID=UPI00143DCF3C|nr:hypothetical protein [Paenibacillus dendritiformis]NKI19808.1 hypothetical protein [Paenibacillus dendritiformis]NRF99926.1 hypothetical protein [Paenibacillus dendritiformis]GIO70782.1 hypothetical protein J27TS7_02960 [Paenibacillus dendritiformis]
MCMAQSYVDQLNKLNRSVTATYEGLNRMQSMVDKELSEVYHEIEAATLDLYREHQLMQRLQDVLKRRRVVKDEFVRIQAVKLALDSSVNKLNQRYLSLAEKSDEIRRSLNVTMTITDVVGEINIMEGLTI